MYIIVADIISLEQYIKTLSQTPEEYRPLYCPVCGMNGLWGHGYYYRKPDRSPEGSQNPIPILRVICQYCQKTHSVLPECIPPRRWYPWFTQQAVFIALLACNSLRHLSKTLGPARSTCRRWWGRFRSKFLDHAEVLRALISDLGRYPDFNAFWQECLNLMPLSKAMRLCHEQGVQIP